MLALVLCLLAAACSWRHEDPPAPRSAACRPGDDTLRIATGGDLTGTDIRALLIQHWAEERKVPVRIVQLPDTADGQRSQLVASLQAGNPYCYDLVNLDVTWTAEFAAQRLITPVDPGGDDFWPAASKGVRYGGESWAVPWNTDVGLLFYRADLIGPGGLGTWDALAETVRTFRRERDPRVRAGLLTQLRPYEGLTVNAAEAVWRAGGEIVSGEGEKARVTVDEPAATAGLLDLVKAVGDEDSPGLPVIGDSSRHLDEQSSLERFLSGDALMLRDWPFAAVQLAQAEKRGTGEYRPRYGVTQLPRPRTGGSAAALGGQNLAVVAGSGHDALARDLLTYLTGAGAERCLRDGGLRARAALRARGGSARPGSTSGG
ncbi:extracellular solute-binding protein, partial [Streptomyces sp. SPB78]|uniref:extracellular solute-binding protein n=1 Tax=Streptomyces sp. (strain SPB78) TaxID=591157 RepID=UPI0001B57371